MSTTPLYGRTTPFTSRGVTAAIWRGELAAFSKDNPVFGSLVISDDFTGPWTDNTTDASAGNGWFIQDSAAGGTSESFAAAAGYPEGVVTLSATTGTDHFGIEAHYGTTATALGCINLPTATTRPRGDVVYETRVNLTNQKQFFIGLTEPIVEFLSATSTLPTNSDYIGFRRHDGGGLDFVMANDNAGGTAVTDSYDDLLTSTEMDALEDASDNWFNLAFRVNKDQTVEIGVNGVWHSASKTNLSATALPIEALTAKYSVNRGATDDQATVSLDIDYIHVFVGPSTT